jgi:hypothetical protein
MFAVSSNSNGGAGGGQMIGTSQARDEVGELISGLAKE